MSDIRSIYQTSLANTHAAEQQGRQAMERQLDGLKRYPNYVALLKRHIEVTRVQLKRIEKALFETGGSVSTVKEAITGTVGTVGAKLHALAQDETLKNLYAGYGFQFYQIAAYRSLKIIAERAGFAQHTNWIDECINEEQVAAEEASPLIETITNRYLELTLSREKADS